MIASTLQKIRIWRKEVMSMSVRFELNRMRKSGMGFITKQNKERRQEMASVYDWLIQRPL